MGRTSPEDLILEVEIRSGKAGGTQRSGPFLGAASGGGPLLFGASRVSGLPLVPRSLVLATLTAALRQMGSQATLRSCTHLLAWGSRLGGGCTPHNRPLDGPAAALRPQASSFWSVPSSLGPAPRKATVLFIFVRVRLYKSRVVLNKPSGTFSCVNADLQNLF